MENSQLQKCGMPAGGFCGLETLGGMELGSFRSLTYLDTKSRLLCLHDLKHAIWHDGKQAGDT